MNTPMNLTKRSRSAVRQPTLFRSLIIAASVFAATLVLYAGARTAPLAPALGIRFVVNSTGDADLAPGDTVCETAVGNGVCTLRAAITLVNTRNNGGDGIGFSIPASDPGCSGSFCTITLNTALPDLAVPVSINGPGAANLSVARNLNMGALRIFNVTTTGTVNISGLTIIDGVAVGDGGGIQNASTGTLNVTNCTISNNSGINGGGISNATNGRIFITDCLIHNNNASLQNNTCYGGGIYNPNGHMEITNSTVSSNTATGAGAPGPGGGFGGGIYNNGLLIVTGSAVISNKATSTDHSAGVGGGVYNYGQLQITNSTIAFNEASSAPDSQGNRYGAYGGIANAGSSVVITNSTITWNVANTDHATSGLSNINTGSANQVQVKSTIIADNYGHDVDGAFTSAGFNLIGVVDGSTGFTAATDQSGTSASPLIPGFEGASGLLQGPILADNGGPTPTIALVCGSPAMDKGTSNGLAGNLTTDQRGAGFARMVNEGISPAAGGDGTDIGAFEFGAGPIVPTSVVSRKYHGTDNTAPYFDIPLPLTCGSIGIECRRNTGSDTSGPNAGHDHELIVTFPTNVRVGSADVADSSGSLVSTPDFIVSNNIVTVNLHYIPNAVRLTVYLRGVNDGTNTGLVSIPIGVLLGDVNGNGVVSNTDVSLVKAQVAAQVGSSNFREDVNANGVISNTDVSLTKAQVGNPLP